MGGFSDETHELPVEWVDREIITDEFFETHAALVCVPDKLLDDLYESCLPVRPAADETEDAVDGVRAVGAVREQLVHRLEVFLSDPARDERVHHWRVACLSDLPGDGVRAEVFWRALFCLSRLDVVERRPELHEVEWWFFRVAFSRDLFEAVHKFFPVFYACVSEEFELVAAEVEDICLVFFFPDAEEWVPDPPRAGSVVVDGVFSRECLCSFDDPVSSREVLDEFSFRVFSLLFCDGVDESGALVLFSYAVLCVLSCGVLVVFSCPPARGASGGSLVVWRDMVVLADVVFFGDYPVVFHAFSCLVFECHESTSIVKICVLLKTNLFWVFSSRMMRNCSLSSRTGPAYLKVFTSVMRTLFSLSSMCRSSSVSVGQKEEGWRGVIDSLWGFRCNPPPLFFWW